MLDTPIKIKIEDDLYDDPDVINEQIMRKRTWQHEESDGESLVLVSSQ